MNMDAALLISAELNIEKKQTLGVLELLDEGASVPFIARYRKEKTGELNEVKILAIRDRKKQLDNFYSRRESILKSLRDQKKLTEELKKKLFDAGSISELEDIYLPYKQKKKTRGSIAKEKGLEPLAVKIFSQENINLLEEAEKYTNSENISTIDDALKGARDIIAEWINEDSDARKKIRKLFMTRAEISSRLVKDKEEEGQKYKNYFSWKEKIAAAPSHRILAILRGTKEGYLTSRILPDKKEAIDILMEIFVKNRSGASLQVGEAVKDSYKRLMAPSMETETRKIYKAMADREAIKVFSINLNELIMSPPLGSKAILAIDPGFRTGCKIACLDKQGKLLDYTTIYPNEPRRKEADSEKTVKELCRKYAVDAIAVGNGTAGRETKVFCEKIDFSRKIPVVMVNENGASIYSASEAAREEFPDLDLTVRGAISIGRRLMDPLAELVKIEPESLGVGQYQHDVDQNVLNQSLENVIAGCVNNVGVELNTASKKLLSYVSGIDKKTAESIIKYRDKRGSFKSRRDLLKIKGMGEKSFEQAAGFLRIRKASNPLDSSAVHPESYSAVKEMADRLNCQISDLIKFRELRDKLNLSDYVTDKIGLPTLKDILEELEKPGRDPRRQFELFTYTEGVYEMEDLETGMKLPGVVTNVTDFGAFVDIGVHQDGLIHISELSDKYVKNPHDIIKTNQKVNVSVIDVDIDRKRISLSLKQ